MDGMTRPIFLSIEDAIAKQRSSELTTQDLIAACEAQIERLKGKIEVLEGARPAGEAPPPRSGRG